MIQGVATTVTTVCHIKYAWAKEEFDFVIENNGTKEELYAKIDDLIVSNKIANTPAKTSDPLQPLAIGTNCF